MNRRGFLSIIGALVASAQCLFGKGDPAPEVPAEDWELRIESDPANSGFRFRWEKPGSGDSTPAVKVDRELTFMERYKLAMQEGPISERDFRTPGFFGPEMDPEKISRELEDAEMRMLAALGD